jgi:hypothetical protein
MNLFRKREDRALREIERKEDEILYLLQHGLSSIRIRFLQGENQVANTDPITLTVGQTVVATVVGFDQNGQPFKGTIPTPQWTIDNASFDSIVADSANPANEDITSLAAGVANLTATVVGPAGALVDTEAITNVAPQVLTSVQIQFSSPTSPAAAKA